MVLQDSRPIVEQALHPPRGLALTELRPGQVGTLCQTCADPSDAMLLRAMGLRPNSLVRVCRVGEPTIVEVMPSRPGEGTRCDKPDCRCRIGLAWVLASRVRVVVNEAP